MEVTQHRKLKSGAWYKGFVQEPNWKSQTIQTGAQVSDTVTFIQKVIGSTLVHTKALAPKLKGGSLRKTCRKIWEFVYDHIRYEKDAPGVEQVRSPARTLHERKGDCDCMSTLIGSILTNLKIPHLLRVTKYQHRSHFQHIYVVVPQSGKKPLILDPVVEWFDYEEPYTYKQDIAMDLQYLHGPELGNTALGLRRRRSIKKMKKKLRGGLLHKINRFNPATIALRGGILAAAKLGKPRKMWEKLLWALVPASEAQRRGANMRNHQRIQGVFERVKRIFSKAGGKAKNLEKALVRGRVNRRLGIVKNHPGLAGPSLEAVNEDSSLWEILGPELYEDEIELSTENLNGSLGVVATGSALAIAMTALGAIAAAVAKIGEIKKASANSGSSGNSNTTLPAPTNPAPESEYYDSTDAYPRNAESSGEAPKKGFFRKENWPLLALGGVGIVSLGAWGIHKLSQKKKAPLSSLEGVPRKKKKKAPTRRRKPKVSAKPRSKTSTSSRRKKTQKPRSRKAVDLS